MTDRGRGATKPWQMPPKALFAIAKRAVAETASDNVGLIAAGVAFYGFLALVPFLGAVVLVYGVAADPATVIKNVNQLAAVMPPDIAGLIGDQLMNVVKTSDGKKGFGILIALALALFSARNGAAAVITALNVAYEENEKRSFIHVNLLALVMTAGAVGVAILAVIAITALGHLEALFPRAPDAVTLAGKIIAYLALVLAGAGGAATLYRYGPSRQLAKWVWLTPGSILAALLWLLLTIGFGIYVANFGDYGATYGSLGTVVVTLTWLFLSSYILLFGAELNSEFEHQTAQDSTVAGAAIGSRGAWVADHVAGDKARLPPYSAPETASGSVQPPARQQPHEPYASFPAAASASWALALLSRGKGGSGLALLTVTAALVWIGREPPARRCVWRPIALQRALRSRQTMKLRSQTCTPRSMGIG